MPSVMSRRTFVKFAGLAGSATLLAACGGGGSAPAPAGPKPSVNLEIASVGDELKWDKTELEAPANSSITLKLSNKSNPSSALQHNWALVKPGQVDAVANAGLAAGEGSGYVKAGDPNVIADTGLIGGGADKSITFDAPAPGQYPYICTFPGHNVTMRGTLTIK